MFSKVIIKRGALNHFRKIARESYPNECQAYLIGNILSVDKVEVTRIAYTTNYHTQTPSQVCWYKEDFEKLKASVENKGLRVVGDIHSHPDWDAVMSPADYEGCITQGLVICGICAVNNNKTRVRFWTPTSSLPCDLEYS